MKNLPYQILITLISGLFLSCANMGNSGLPNLEKSLTRSILLFKADPTETKQSYTFMTSKSFKETKDEFEAYIGEEWLPVPGSADINANFQKSLRSSGESLKKVTVNGSVLYLNTDYPNTRLIIVHASISKVLNAVYVVYEEIVATE